MHAAALGKVGIRSTPRNERGGPVLERILFERLVSLRIAEACPFGVGKREEEVLAWLTPAGLGTVDVGFRAAEAAAAPTAAAVPRAAKPRRKATAHVSLARGVISAGEDEICKHMRHTDAKAYMPHKMPRQPSEPVVVR